MPIGMDPNQTFKVVLETDKSKDPCPCFVFRYLTGRTWKEVAKVSDSIEGAQSAEQLIGEIFRALRIGVVGWENMSAPGEQEILFNPAVLEDILTPREAIELLRSLVNQTPTPSEDKKKLD